VVGCFVVAVIRTQYERSSMEEKFLSPVFSVGALEEKCQSREEEHVDSAVDRFFFGDTVWMCRSAVTKEATIFYVNLILWEK
jgi:hypothetical protein